MDPITRLNRLMEALRQQLAGSAKRMDSQTGLFTTTEAQSRGRSERPSIQELRSRVETRLLALESGTPDRKRRARRIFFESVLTWEFGDELLLDNQFARMIDNIQETVEADPEMDRQFDELLSSLSVAKR